MKAIKFFLLGILLITVFTGCEKYYDKKFDEEYEISGSYNGTPFSQSGALEFGMFSFEDYNVLLYNEIYIDFEVNGIFEEQYPNTSTRIDFYLEMSNVIGPTFNMSNKPKSAKKIAKFINASSSWNSSSTRSIYILPEPNDTTKFNYGNNMVFEGDYSISASNKGDWLFIEGDIPRLRMERTEPIPGNPQNKAYYYFDNFKFKFTVEVPS